MGKALVPIHMDDSGPVRGKKAKLNREPVREKREKVKIKAKKAKDIEGYDNPEDREVKKKKKRLKYGDLSSNKKVAEIIPEKSLGVFRKSSREIQRLLDNRDNDPAILLIQRRMLQTIVDLIPIAEEKYREYGNERAAYALNTLMDRASVLISDIISSEDRAQIMDRILMQVLEPVIKDHAQMFFMSMLNLKTNLGTEMPKHTKSLNSHLDQASREVAQHLQASFQEMKQRLEGMM